MTYSDRADRFTVEQWEVKSLSSPIGAPVLLFYYNCSRFGRFTETVTFSPLRADAHAIQPLAPLIDLLALAIGVSYYKAGAAKHVQCHLPLTPAGARLLTALYTEGLAEFFIRNALPYPAQIEFTIPPAPRRQSEQIDNNGVIMAFGGGKDSYVARSILQQAQMTTEPCAVVMSDKVAQALQGCSQEKITFLQRQLAPNLYSANHNGAFNGHVPITAINSLMLILYAAMTNRGSVVFANERSADEATIQTDQYTANHQYSKSEPFESLLRGALAECGTPIPNYYSILRPFSEIRIARIFTRLTSVHGLFTSCNNNFQIRGQKASRWCGACAKCAFTCFLLAPSLTLESFDAIFPSRFLNQENLLPFYRNLCGLSDQKPWDCVGTINECRATLYQLSLHPDFKDSLVVTTLLPEVLALCPPKQLQHYWQDGLTLTAPHHLPAPILEAAKRVPLDETHH